MNNTEHRKQNTESRNSKTRMSCSSLFSSFYSLPSRSRGFTLVELLVVMGIMIVISTLVLARYSQFNGVILLRDLAYDVALSFREAQVFGISGKSSGGTFAYRYGVYIAKGAPTQYILFGDRNNNSAYDSNEVITAYSMRAGYGISEICAHRSDGYNRCASTNDLANLTVMFKRPEPDAIIRTDATGEVYTDATVTLTSASGATRSVTVTSTGQIAVNQGN